MHVETPSERVELYLTKLERQVEALLAVCARLGEENRSLRAQQAALMAERARLIDKNETARARIEAMIARLRAMEP